MRRVPAHSHVPLCCAASGAHLRPELGRILEYGLPAIVCAWVSGLAGWAGAKWLELWVIKICFACDVRPRERLPDFSSETRFAAPIERDREGGLEMSHEGEVFTDLLHHALAAAPRGELFLRGPVPLEWLQQAAALPGKTLNVAIALWWLHGMAKGKPFKLTRQALKYLNVERDAASAGLIRLERAGLIGVERKPGQRPTISMLIRAAGFCLASTTQVRTNKKLL